MISVSHLHFASRRHVQWLVVQGSKLLLSRIDDVHYSEAGNRWDGIANRKLIAHPGRVFPFYGDCSSTATWLLWNGLAHEFGCADDVNGERWRGGFTGTMAGHGKLVRHDADIRVGDLVLYGPPPTFEHVAVALGGGKVFSHGSEAGPFKLPIDYRPDRAEVRRYI